MVITKEKARQFISIANSCENGNWTEATEKCVRFGLSGMELVELYENRTEELGDEYELLSMRDIVYLTMYTERMIAANREQSNAEYVQGY